MWGGDVDTASVGEWSPRWSHRSGRKSSKMNSTAKCPRPGRATRYWRISAVVQHGEGRAPPRFSAQDKPHEWRPPYELHILPNIDTPYIIDNLSCCYLEIISQFPYLPHALLLHIIDIHGPYRERWQSSNGRNQRQCRKGAFKGLLEKRPWRQKNSRRLQSWRETKSKGKVKESDRKVANPRINMDSQEKIMHYTASGFTKWVDDRIRQYTLVNAINLDFRKAFDTVPHNTVDSFII